MKRIFTILLGLAAIGASLPSFAGPDWQVIEHGRKVKLARMQSTSTHAAATTPTAPDNAK